jgi:hypothetical protein
MAILGRFSDARLFMGGYNMSGLTNNITLAYNTNLLDATVMGNATKISIAGLTDYSITASGHMPTTSAADLTEKVLFDQVGGVAIPFTVMPGPAPAEGSRAFFFEAVQATHTYGAAHGALLPYNITGQSADSGYPMIRGYVVEPGATARTGAASPFISTGSNALGAIAANEYLYAVLHVTAVNTPTTLDITIENDDAADFAGADTVATFTTVTTGVGSQYIARVPGPFTDTYWRCNAVIVGTSYTFAIAIGKA